MNKYNSNNSDWNSNKARADVSGLFITEALQESIIVGAIGVWHLVKSFFDKRGFLTVPTSLTIILLSYFSAKYSLHIELLYQWEPKLFQFEIVRKALTANQTIHFICLTAIGFIPLVIIIGLIARTIRTKFQKIFYQCRLTNGLGDTPKLISTKSLDRRRRQYIFDGNGIGISEFKKKTEQIECLMRKNIESIQYGTNKGRICITLSNRAFPTTVKYSELISEKVLPADSFYIGKSLSGVVTKKIAELPHLLIAGTTGSGKSVFFKQVLMGLLESAEHLQMYLIDLKGGLEMIDFKACPNVRVIKTLPEAVNILRMVDSEMKSRFALLEKQNRKQIDPKYDRMDRIVVAVDEASVLYMARSRIDPEFHLAVEARKLADSISKLSRAAAIHLLLATQKLDKQVIPTSVSENISGRMAFRANSLQGSLIVLGCKDAMELPDIPGRGIWVCGNEKQILQAPYIDEKTIKQRCSLIKDLFDSNKRIIRKEMLGANSEKSRSRLKSAIYGKNQQTNKELLPK